jgi:terminase small subunit-like protein
MSEIIDGRQAVLSSRLEAENPKPIKALKKNACNRPLTMKQEAFAIAYVKHGNASRAYRECYDIESMTSKTVNERSCELRKSGKVSARIAELRAPAAQKALLSIEKTAEHLAQAAYAKPKKGVTWGNKLEAIEKVMRHLGMFERDNSQRQPNLALQIVVIGPP